ncbi:hypothetical protein L3X38_020797 [Prunus dulcis]|uniref:Uncharacterized protein n=1 Tax=Prunus dulcis TaxID=3755 RepID=A0AAD4US52_PRUDU|nr:hypothetical protein L3X38_020797 [Prunus dulcis]
MRGQPFKSEEEEKAQSLDLTADLATRTNHEAIEHLSHQFDISSILFSDNCLVMSINDQKSITCKEELLSWIKNVPNGIALADFADHMYDTLLSDLKDLEHSKEVTLLHSNFVGGEVVYPMQQLGVEDELEVEDEQKVLFRKIDVQNIESVNKCLRMQVWKPPTGSSKRAAAAAAESKKLNKRSKG